MFSTLKGIQMGTVVTRERRNPSKTFCGAMAAASLTICFGASAAPDPVAAYSFANSLSSSVAGAPSLGVVDPLSQSGFVTDIVNGNSQTVFNFHGTATPVTDQAGLTLNTTGLISNAGIYSLEMVFKFTEHDNLWRRIFDVQERQSDNGFYIDPSNHLDVFPLAGGASFTNGVYHDVFLTVDSGTVKFYLDGSAQATVLTHIMDLPSDGKVNFFLDNVIAGGQGEFSSGDIALIRLYNAALTDVPPPPTDVSPPVASIPEPSTYALMLAGLLGVTTAVRRRASRPLIDATSAA